MSEPGQPADGPVEDGRAPRWEPPTGPPLQAPPPPGFGEAPPTPQIPQTPPGAGLDSPGPIDLDASFGGGDGAVAHGLPAQVPDRRGRIRPWWGMGDALLMIPIMILVLIASFVLIGVLAVIEDIELAELGELETSALPASMIVLPTLIQQGAWFVWPFIVSKWKGLGPASDWGWSFKPVDLGIGLGTAMIALFSAGLVAAGTGALVGLEDESLAENTQIITDLEGSPWLYGILFVVVIGAPVSEEILFRGLIMRSIEKRWGTVAGVIGSLLVFVPIHLADGGVFGAGQIVLWASIATLGAVLTITAAVTRRLAGPIIAHMVINAVASAGALGWFDSLTEQLPT